MNREDVLKVDELKEELTTAFRSFERSLRGVFGEMVYAVDTVVERYNELEKRYNELESRPAQQQTQLDAVSARLLTLERASGEH